MKTKEEIARHAAESLHSTANSCSLSKNINIILAAMDEAVKLAAAPELLDALKSVVHDLQWGTTGRRKGEGSATLIAAIAKAEGA